MIEEINWYLIADDRVNLTFRHNRNHRSDDYNMRRFGYILQLEIYKLQMYLIFDHFFSNIHSFKQSSTQQNVVVYVVRCKDYHISTVMPSALPYICYEDQITRKLWELPCISEIFPQLAIIIVVTTISFVITREGIWAPLHWMPARHYSQTSNILYIKSEKVKFLVSPCSCLCPRYWNKVLSREWRCSWSSTVRWCSNYIWEIKRSTIL